MMTFSDDDPMLDVDAAAHLEAVGQRSMARSRWSPRAACSAPSRRPPDAPVTFGERHIARLLLDGDRGRDGPRECRLYDAAPHAGVPRPLTGLANRALLLDRIGHALVRRAGRPASTPSCSWTSMTSSRSTTTWATPAAIGSSRVVAGAAGGCLRPRDTAARIGGDEFAILLEDLRDEEEATLVARRNPRGARRTDRHRRCEPCGRDERRDRHRRARREHRRAAGAQRRLRDVPSEGSRQGTLRAVPSRTCATRRRSGLRCGSRSGAVERGELGVHYQPIVDLEDGQALGRRRPWCAGTTRARRC